MNTGTLAFAGAAVIGLLTLGGCDLEQHGQRFNLGGGRNVVAHENPLNERQLEALRERVAYQGWPSGEGFGMTSAGIYYAGTNVRPPGAPASDVPPAAGGKP